jgi:hypothetical protein
LFEEGRKVLEEVIDIAFNHTMGLKIINKGEKDEHI